MNRIKAVVIGLFAGYWVVVIVLLISARPVFDVILDQQTRVTGDHRPAELATVFVLTVLLSLLSVGVLLGWRWTFWLILVVFMAGILRCLPPSLNSPAASRLKLPSGMSGSPL